MHGYGNNASTPIDVWISLASTDRNESNSIQIDSFVAPSNDPFVWPWTLPVSQVRTPAAVQAVTSFVVAAYAFLLLAAAQTGRIALPPPKWRPDQPAQRDSTPRLLGALRHQLWGKALGVNLTHVAYNTKGKTTDVEIASALPSAVLYAFRSA